LSCLSRKGGCTIAFRADSTRIHVADEERFEPYRYYVSHAILQNEKHKAGGLARFPAPELKTRVRLTPHHLGDCRRHSPRRGSVPPRRTDEESPVNRTERDLANRLFAVAMGVLEDAIEPAIRGQAHTASRTRILASAAALTGASQKISAKRPGWPRHRRKGRHFPSVRRRECRDRAAWLRMQSHSNRSQGHSSLLIRENTGNFAQVEGDVIGQYAKDVPKIGALGASRDQAVREINREFRRGHQGTLSEDQGSSLTASFTRVCLVLRYPRRTDNDGASKSYHPAHCRCVERGGH
jgi:hypothetical protein